jgi:hypothetical protein
VGQCYVTCHSPHTTVCSSVVKALSLHTHISVGQGQVLQAYWQCTAVLGLAGYCSLKLADFHMIGPSRDKAGQLCEQRLLNS